MQHHMLYKCTLGMFHLIVLKQANKSDSFGKKTKENTFWLI